MIKAANFLNCTFHKNAIFKGAAKDHGGVSWGPQKPDSGGKAMPPPQDFPPQDMMSGLGQTCESNLCSLPEVVNWQNSGWHGMRLCSTPPQ